MNTTAIMDENKYSAKELPGALLSAIRNQKGYTTEYVAGKLHLRVRLIELLEADDYSNMPEPVFIKGYIRAYAKFLDVDAGPLLEIFNSIYTTEKKVERALWQTKKETHKAEHALRWVTIFFAVGVVTAVAIWWQTNKDNERFLPTNMSQTEKLSTKSESEIRLTDLSKMRSLLSSATQYSPEAPLSRIENSTEVQFSKIEGAKSE